MKCRYLFSIEGDLRPDLVFPFEANGLRYEFQRDKSGFLTGIKVTVEVPDCTLWPKFTRISGSVPVANIQVPSPRLLQIRQDLRVVEGLLAPYGLHSINLSEPKQEWVPEDEKEKAQLSVYSSHHRRSHMPRGKAESSPFSLVVLSILAAKQVAPFELAITFLRKGYLDMEEWRYIEAIYDFYFMLETLFGNGKTKNADVQREFLASPILFGSIKKAISDPKNLNLFLSDPECTTSFQIKYQSKTPEEIIASMIKLRGFLHHQSRKRRDGWHPDDPEAYRVDAILFQLICLQVFYAITNPLVFAPEFTEISNSLWDQHKRKSPVSTGSRESDNLPSPVIPPESKDRMHKRLSDFFQAVDTGRPSTLILTTDGTHYFIKDSLYPLPPSYLKQWEEDSHRSELEPWDD
jgi:hypothetical protein